LSINYTSEIFTLGNDNTGNGIFADNLNFNYFLGHDAHANIRFDVNQAKIKCEDLQLDGGGLITSIGTTSTGTALLITINNVPYKINLTQ
jgi:hypothetical protein